MSDTVVLGLATGLLTGLLAVAAALGSQWIAARAALRAKKIEVIFARKTDAYQRLFKAAVDMRNAPNFTPELRGELRAALVSAYVLALPNVADLLVVLQQEMHPLIEAGDRDGAVGRWDGKADVLLRAIRADINSLT